MKLFKITLDVENWKPSIVVEIVRAKSHNDAISKIRESFIYSRQSFTVKDIQSI